MPNSSRKTNQSKVSKPSTSTQTKSDLQQSSSDEENDKSHRKYSQISEAPVDIDLLTTNLVKYVLNYSCNKIPIKRADATKNLNIPRKNQKEVFEEAQKLLKEIYGLEFVEVPENKSSKQLITYSSFSFATPLQMSPDETKDSQLLFIILSYIFMKSIDVPEENLVNFVEQLGISSEDYSKLRDKFVRQLYLKRQKIEIEGRNEPHFTIVWGERAKLEFDKKKVLATVAKIMGKSPRNFINQYHEAHGEQNIPTQVNESMAVD